MLLEVRQAIADAVGVIDGLQVSPYMLSNPTPPTAHVYPTPVNYDETFQRGMDTWTLTLQVFVSENAGDEGSQRKLDEYLEPFGARSVKQAVEYGGGTLGDLVFSCRVTSSSGYRVYVTQGQGSVLGCEWEIEVKVDGSEES